jgi:sugar phosphate isomerase/epimerase
MGHPLPLSRAFSFWRVDDPESVREEVLEVLQQATSRVRSAGLLLGMENEYSCNIATGEESVWFLDRISDPTFGLIWDPGNTAALGVPPLPDDFIAVRDRIHHVHIKDAVRLGEPGSSPLSARASSTTGSSSSCWRRMGTTA